DRHVPASETAFGENSPEALRLADRLGRLARGDSGEARLGQRLSHPLAEERVDGLVGEDRHPSRDPLAREDRPELVEEARADEDRVGPSPSRDQEPFHLSSCPCRRRGGPSAPPPGEAAPRSPRPPGPPKDPPSPATDRRVRTR